MVVSDRLRTHARLASGNDPVPVVIAGDVLDGRLDTLDRAQPGDERRQLLDVPGLCVGAGAREPADVGGAELQQRMLFDLVIQRGEADALDPALRPALAGGVDERLELERRPAILKGLGLPRRTAAPAEQPLHLEGALSALVSARHNARHRASKINGYAVVVPSKRR